MKSVTVTAVWVGDGKSTKTAFRPALLDDYPLTAPGESWKYITGGNPVKGEPCVGKIIASQTKIDLIKADPKYADKVTEEIKHETES